jgi:hypothetical protein
VLLVCWGFFIDETVAIHSSQRGGSFSLLSHRASRVDVIDVWVWPPVVVNGVLHGSNGEEVEALILLRTIPDVGSKWSL